MLVKLFGIMDLYACCIILLLHFGLGFPFFTVIAASYLIIKWVMFKEDIISLIDGLVGVYVILMLFGITSFLDFFLAIWLLQKGLFSLIEF